MVCSPLEPSLSFHLGHVVSHWNATCAHGWQYGGGLYISGTATLTDTSLYENESVYVSLPVEPSLRFSSSAPLEHHVNITCAHGRQYGGGLYMWGTATLTGTNVYVYKNRANDVCLRLLNLP